MVALCFRMSGNAESIWNSIKSTFACSPHYHASRVTRFKGQSKEMDDGVRLECRRDLITCCGHLAQEDAKYREARGP
ncbi:hypothetical protein BDY21DRAFT_346686 [Lineolata rhizophorae]|uniref:Uncharacterized protein n=1 Tax=Lineolata rhizophorae TaxID=578093 RepID=A0A6A6NZ66_9PEZI|nr:hypothetical protein BDY21DRAFT_346686 [Lineolata rhizophorae]